MTKDKKPKHAAKLLGDIDKGKAGDKIGFPDPAAAPLGTDAEAGGASSLPEEVRTAHHHEVGQRSPGTATANGPRPVSAGSSSASKQRNWIAIMMILSLVMIGLVLFYAVLQ